MTSICLKKNIYMKKRFGIFKSIVYRRMQMFYFVKHSMRLCKKNQKSKGCYNKLITCIELFEYFLRTRDIWSISYLSNNIRDKIFYIFYQKPLELQDIITRLGYICPYSKLDGKICGRKVNGGLCSLHNRCKYRLKTRLFSHLPKQFPTEIVKIVLVYALPYIYV